MNTTSSQDDASMNPTAAHPAERTRARGFSLIELLLATVLGSMLLIALANSARIFGEQVTHVQDAADARLEQALVAVTDSVSAAWTVERSSATRLLVADALGRTTILEQQGSTLRVTRPSGASGVLLDNVASVSFDAQSTRRYVEAPPLVGYAAFWSQPPPAGTPTTLTIRAGESVAIGFSIPADAPPTVDTLAEVAEQCLDVTFDRMVIALSFFDGSPKEFCHLHAPGPPHSSNHSSGSTSLAVDVYEARAPGDARPWGSALGTVGVPTVALPAATYKWLNMATLTDVTPPEVINPPAGVAWGWWADNAQVQLVVDEAPAIDVPVDLVPLGTTIQPGRAYTLVLRVSGVDYVNIEAYPLGSTAGSNVATRTTPTGAFTTQPLAIPLRLEGVRRWSQTTAHDAVSRVTTTIVLQDGTRVSGSAGVLAQTAVADAWSGPVPGSTPALSLAGQ
jgi:prepilin-type N-terminal cleavage/methylation domain-containing protein